MPWGREKNPRSGRSFPVKIGHAFSVARMRARRRPVVEGRTGVTRVPAPHAPAAAPGEVERLRRLQRVADAALSNLELDDLLDALLVRTREVLEVDACTILVLDEATDELTPRAAIGL